MIRKQRVSRSLLLALAFSIGMILQPASQQLGDPLLMFYDYIYPVAKMEADIVARGPDSVDLHIYGKKQRNCTYVQMHSFAKSGDVMTDVHQKRIDIAEQGATKPIGVYDIGVWRVWPVAGATYVLMYVHHTCNGRHVLTKIADEKL